MDKKLYLLSWKCEGREYEARFATFKEVESFANDQLFVEDKLAVSDVRVQHNPEL
jgi:hypothetical protein